MTSKTANLLIYGAGGFGREVAWLVEGLADTGLRVVGFVDDSDPKAERINGYPVLSLIEALGNFPEASIALSPGSGVARRRLAERTNNHHHPILIDRSVRRSPLVEFGEGSVVCAGTTLTTNIQIGRFVHINLHCTIGHDAVLEDFVTLAPGVHVSGAVRVESGAYVGTGAVIINGTPDRPLVVGRDSIVGAGAVVVRDVPAGETHIGVPAKRRS